jgi:bifunctional non-homologous end joining protein LigD
VGPSTILPMKAVSGELPHDPEGWGFEVKWDGYRVIAFVEPSGQPRVKLQSSNGLDLTARWPELAVIADDVNAASVVLDGEVVVFEADGRTSFGRLARGEGTATFVAFDVLAVNGTDTTALPLSDRRRLLTQLLETSPHVLVSPLHDDGAALAEATRAAGMEGIVAKRLDSRYQPGRRSPSWRKIKHRRRQEFVVVGWQESDRGRSSTFASLILAVNERPAGASSTSASSTGTTLRYCGSVGTGFDETALVALRARLDALAVDRAPLVALPPKAAVTRPHWVRPELVAEVEFAEWTDDGIVRHASYLGLRDDKSVHDVVREA